VDGQERPGHSFSLEFADAWQLTMLQPNALTLDYCAYRIGDGAWQGPLPHLRVLQLVHAAGLGLPFSLRYAFVADLASIPDLTLVVERPQDFRITVNGQEVRHDLADGYWVDTSFRRIPIGHHLHQGENEIVLEGTSALDTEIEACYVVGTFGVAETPEGFRLVAAPTRASAGNLVTQGLPFYAGSVRLRQTAHIPRVGEHAELVLEGLSAIVAMVRVNGKEAGKLAWRPHRLDVSGLLVQGENEIEVELVGSLHNLLGPHHHKAGELLSVGPGSFQDWANWTDEYTFVPFGLGRVRLLMG